MTVYQAVRSHAPMDIDPDTETDHGLGNSSLWTQTHVIWCDLLHCLSDPRAPAAPIILHCCLRRYRQAPEASATAKTSVSASRKSKADSGSKSRGGKWRKQNDFFTGWNSAFLEIHVGPIRLFGRQPAFPTGI